MAGRPPKKDKKVREAIYFEPDLLQWLSDMADKQMCTISVVVNRICAEAKKKEV